MRYSKLFPWQKTERGQGFFVPCLNVHEVRVAGLNEALRHRIPIEEVLSIIMESNMSKLGKGSVAIIENGKVQKGPHYWKPEPKIRELLNERCK